MLYLQDGIIAFLSVVGLATLVWLVSGVFLRGSRTDVPGLLLVLPLRGEAPAMEADVRALRRIRGQLPGARILLADCGLSTEARALAEYLARRQEGAELVDAEMFEIE